uniref:Tryptophan synthase n=1 Tax=Parastrongyloides trichosuri TaxID=131310 RepID=A0A0N5A5Q6_PARTI
PARHDQHPAGHQGRRRPASRNRGDLMSPLPVSPDLLRANAPVTPAPSKAHDRRCRNRRPARATPDAPDPRPDRAPVVGNGGAARPSRPGSERGDGPDAGDGEPLSARVGAGGRRGPERRRQPGRFGPGLRLGAARHAVRHRRLLEGRRAGPAGAVLRRFPATHAGGRRPFPQHRARPGVRPLLSAHRRPEDAGRAPLRGAGPLRQGIRPRRRHPHGRGTGPDRRLRSGGGGKSRSTAARTGRGSVEDRRECIGGLAGERRLCRRPDEDDRLGARGSAASDGRGDGNGRTGRSGGRRPTARSPAQRRDQGLHRRFRGGFGLLRLSAGPVGRCGEDRRRSGARYRHRRPHPHDGRTSGRALRLAGTGDHRRDDRDGSGRRRPARSGRHPRPGVAVRAGRGRTAHRAEHPGDPRTPSGRGRRLELT